MKLAWLVLIVLVVICYASLVTWDTDYPYLVDVGVGLFVGSCVCFMVEDGRTRRGLR